MTSNVYIEQGITFNPKVNDNKKYNIQSNFEERNQKLIELKKQILYKMNETNVKRTLSKEKIKENNQRVVQRLYNNEMEKLKRKNMNKKELQAVVTYKENLRKSHKISFKKNYFSNENTKQESKDIDIQEESLMDHIETLNKDNETHIVQLSEIPIDLNTSSKKDINITKQSSILNTNNEQNNIEIKDNDISKESILINKLKDSLYEEKRIVSPEMLIEEIKNEHKENEDLSRNLIEVKSKTLQNLLNKNKK